MCVLHLNVHEIRTCFNLTQLRIFEPNHGRNFADFEPNLP